MKRPRRRAGRCGELRGAARRAKRGEIKRNEYEAKRNENETQRNRRLRFGVP